LPARSARNAPIGRRRSAQAAPQGAAADGGNRGSREHRPRAFALDDHHLACESLTCPLLPASNSSRFAGMCDKGYPAASAARGAAFGAKCAQLPRYWPWLRRRSCGARVCAILPGPIATISVPWGNGCHRPQSKFLAVCRSQVRFCKL
jgi:hypothetical protein